MVNWKEYKSSTNKKYEWNNIVTFNDLPNGNYLVFINAYNIASDYKLGSTGGLGGFIEAKTTSTYACNQYFTFCTVTDTQKRSIIWMPYSDNQNLTIAATIIGLTKSTS